MPAIFDLLYREYCRARLAEMRKQLLISPKTHEIAEVRDRKANGESVRLLARSYGVSPNTISRVR